MKKFIITLSVLAVSALIFFLTYETTTQKARSIIEKDIKERAHDPWSYEFDKIYTDTIGVNTLKIQNLIEMQKPEFFIEEMRSNQHSYGGYRAREKALDSLSKQPNPAWIIKFIVVYRIKTIAGGYMRSERAVYYNLKSKKFNFKLSDAEYSK